MYQMNNTIQYTRLKISRNATHDCMLQAKHANIPDALTGLVTALNLRQNVTSCQVVCLHEKLKYLFIDACMFFSNS